MLPRAMIWGPMYSGKKKSRGSLLAFRTYLDELSGTQVDWNPWSGAEPEPAYLAESRVVTASRVLLESAFGWRWYLGDRVTRQSLGALDFQVPGPLPPHASHTDKYTLAELRRFTVPTGLAAFLRPERDYAVYRRQHLARPLGVLEHVAVQSEALEAGEERRSRESRASRPRERSDYATATGLPRLSWTLAVRDTAGEEAIVRFEPARTDPAEITGPCVHLACILILSRNMSQAPIEWASMPKLLASSLNISRGLANTILEGGQLKIMRLIKMYSPDGDLASDDAQARRRFALVICLLAAYLLVPADGRVSPSLVSVAAQMGARRNVVPLVLAETLLVVAVRQVESLASSGSGLESLSEEDPSKGDAVSGHGHRRLVCVHAANAA
ncbi:uncharacterized protein LOC131309706 [Rhododendron vialii]|uniref:uncharacterized protein LOC131309706 n=1 Tax=Rhododendron vialii TaxID=182163 RepID=UPI00265FA3F3|nr:uncharacterized protein LOC131309706 [Rhododendron vialii]